MKVPVVKDRLRSEDFINWLEKSKEEGGYYHKYPEDADHWIEMADKVIETVVEENTTGSYNALCCPNAFGQFLIDTYEAWEVKSRWYPTSEQLIMVFVDD